MERLHRSIMDVGAAPSCWVRDQEFLSPRLLVAPGRFFCQEITFKGDIVLSSQPCVILTLSKYDN